MPAFTCAEHKFWRKIKAVLNLQGISFDLLMYQDDTLVVIDRKDSNAVRGTITNMLADTNIEANVDKSRSYGPDPFATAAEHIFPVDSNGLKLLGSTLTADHELRLGL